MRSWTDTLRITMLVLFVVSAICMLAGWFFDHDPSQLTSLLGVEALGLGIGEASNVGKRATFDVEAARFMAEKG